MKVGSRREGPQPAFVTRTEKDCHEWQCSSCGGKWTVKLSNPTEAFAFFPTDIEAAVSDEVEPLEVGP
jgi:hypothetical protein